jgi:hypothetical protein
MAGYGLKRLAIRVIGCLWVSSTRVSRIRLLMRRALLPAREREDRKNSAAYARSSLPISQYIT